MQLADVTLVIGVDRHHLEELRWSWPTWVKFKPEILQMPTIIFYDPAQVRPEDATFLRERPINWIAWTWKGGGSQREKMLTGFVHIAATHVKTSWYLKLDTDVIATGAGEWLLNNWFSPSAGRGLPVFVSSEWEYSSPAHVIKLLDDWADTVPQLTGYPRLNFRFTEADRHIKHKRVISWLFFGRTDWTRLVRSWMSGGTRLPWPSHDTFLSFCALRSQACFVRAEMSEFRWAHARLWRARNLVRSLGVQPGLICDRELI